MTERKVVIVTDVAADLPSTEELKIQYGVGPIARIPLGVSFGTRNFAAGLDMDDAHFVRLIHESGQIPKTGALGPETFLQVYKEQLQGGLEILSLHIGDNLSGVGNQARVAANMIGSNRVSIYNTQTTSMGQGLMAIAAEKAAAQGASREEIIEMLNRLKSNIDVRVVTPNIPFLRASGRASHLTAALAEALQIKPMLQIDHGVVDNVAKPRTMRRALDWMADFAQNAGKLEQVVILDFETKADAQALTERLVAAQIPESRIHRGNLGPITASHSGPGTLAMITMREQSI